MLRLKDQNVNYILRAFVRRICRLKLLSFNTYYMLRLRKKDILLVNAAMNWNIDGVVHQNSKSRCKIISKYEKIQFTC